MRPRSHTIISFSPQGEDLIMMFNANNDGLYIDHQLASVFPLHHKVGEKFKWHSVECCFFYQSLTGKTGKISMSHSGDVLLMVVPGSFRDKELGYRLKNDTQVELIVCDGDTIAVVPSYEFYDRTIWQIIKWPQVETCPIEMYDGVGNTYTSELPRDKSLWKYLDMSTLSFYPFTGEPIIRVGNFAIHKIAKYFYVQRYNRSWTTEKFTHIQEAIEAIPGCFVVQEEPLLYARETLRQGSTWGEVIDLMGKAVSYYGYCSCKRLAEIFSGNDIAEPSAPDTESPATELAAAAEVVEAVVEPKVFEITEIAEEDKF